MCVFPEYLVYVDRLHQLLDISTTFKCSFDGVVVRLWLRGKRSGVGARLLPLQGLLDCLRLFKIKEKFENKPTYEYKNIDKGTFPLCNKYLIQHIKLPGDDSEFRLQLFIRC